MYTIESFIEELMRLKGILKDEKFPWGWNHLFNRMNMRDVVFVEGECEDPNTIVEYTLEVSDTIKIPMLVLCKDGDTRDLAASIMYPNLFLGKTANEILEQYEVTYEELFDACNNDRYFGV